MTGGLIGSFIFSERLLRLTIMALPGAFKTQFFFAIGTYLCVCAAHYLLALAARKKTLPASQHSTILTFCHVVFAIGFPADEARSRTE